MSLRIALLACLLSFTAPAFAQDAMPSPSGQWQPDTQQNDKLLKQAEKKFEAAAKTMRPAGGKPEGDMGSHRGGGGRGGMDGGMGGGMGGHGFGGRGGSRHGGGQWERPSLSGLLPAELAFAAPADEGLILQRMRDAVAFGRSENNAVVVIPFDGKADLGNGVQATVRDEDGVLVLQAETPSGLRVQYRYRNPSDSPGALQVDIDINGQRLPGGGLTLQRLYRRAQVDVAKPEQTRS